MKRILFCAGLLAVMASCTQDEFEQQAISNEAQTPGISFAGQFAQAPTTRGEVYWSNQTLEYRWYAEQDRINVYAKDVIKGGAVGTGEDGETITTWNQYQTGSPASTPAEYKATLSENDPRFTGKDDDNILYFGTTSATNPAEFLAVYPTTTHLDFGTDDKILIKDLPSLANQTQANGTDGNSVAKNTLMMAYGTGYKDATASYKSVGEKVNLTFSRPLGYLTWGTANLDQDPVLEAVNESLKEYFGDLKTIKLEAKGYNADGKGTVGDDDNDIAPSILDYGNATIQIDMPTPNNPDIVWYDEQNHKSNLTFKSSNGSADAIWETAGTETANVDNASHSVTLTYNGGQWSDAYTAYMLVSPVDRKDFQEKKVMEDLEVTYTFDHITLVAGENNPEGLIRGNGYPMPAGNFALNQNWGFTDNYTSFVLDIAKYPYLVTEATSSNDRVLIINDASFAKDIMKDGSQVDWNGSKINPTEFAVIISKTPIYDAANDVNEYSYLQKFTNLKKLVLINDKEIPAYAFNRSNFAQLTEINFPAVGSDETIEEPIKSNSFIGFGKDGNNGLTKVYLKSYPFENRDIAFSFLDDDKLVELDMSAATMMNVGFPSQGFLLEGYTNLTTVTIGTVEAGPNAFDGCTSLSTIKPAEGQDQANIKLTNNSFAAFRGTALTEIHLAETSKIPAYAFQNCLSLEYVTSDGTTLTDINDYAFQNCAQLKSENPTTGGTSIVLDEVETIGEYAFDKCEAWTKAHLDKTTEIGNYAFRQSGLTGDVYTINGTKRNVLYVGAAKVGEYAFEAGKFEHIEFKNLTDISNGLLYDCKNLLQIQFNQVFTYGENIRAASFGANTDQVILFVNPAQENRNATTLNPGKANAVTFKSILEIGE